jgi:3-isopropylmalate/(R)-2-methylmalate dehydratase small subunit
MESFPKLTSGLVPLSNENVDTDQIIPARYLKVTDKNGLGEVLFSDWRYRVDGTPNPEFVLNRPGHAGKQILLVGDNFGCGSSREHAPWALLGYGFRALIGTSFADIFHNNSLKNGLLPVVVDRETHQQLFSLVAEEPDTTVTIDLATQSLHLPDRRVVTFPLDPFSKSCLLNGVDSLGYLLRQEPAIAGFEASRPSWM